MKFADELDFDLSSIQGDRESQFTIFWLDNTLLETPKTHNDERPLSKIVSSGDGRPPRKIPSKRASRYLENPPNNQNLMLSPNRLYSYNENKTPENKLQMKAGAESARNYFSLIPNKGEKKLSSENFGKIAKLSSGDSKELSLSRNSLDIKHFSAIDEIAENEQKREISSPKTQEKFKIVRKNDEDYEIKINDESDKKKFEKSPGKNEKTQEITDFHQQKTCSNEETVDFKMENNEKTPKKPKKSETLSPKLEEKEKSVGENSETSLNNSKKTPKKNEISNKTYESESHSTKKIINLKSNDLKIVKELDKTNNSNKKPEKNENFETPKKKDLEETKNSRIGSTKTIESEKKMEKSKENPLSGQQKKNNVISDEPKREKMIETPDKKQIKSEESSMKKINKTAEKVEIPKNDDNLFSNQKKKTAENSAKKSDLPISKQSEEKSKNIVTEDTTNLDEINEIKTNIIKQKNSENKRIVPIKSENATKLDEINKNQTDKTQPYNSNDQTVKNNENKRVAPIKKEPALIAPKKEEIKANLASTKKPNIKSNDIEENALNKKNNDIQENLKNSIKEPQKITKKITLKEKNQINKDTEQVEETNYQSKSVKEIDSVPQKATKPPIRPKVTKFFSIKTEQDSEEEEKNANLKKTVESKSFFQKGSANKNEEKMEEIITSYYKKPNLKSNSETENVLKNKTFQQRLQIAQKDSKETLKPREIKTKNQSDQGTQNRFSSPILNKKLISSPHSVDKRALNTSFFLIFQCIINLFLKGHCHQATSFHLMEIMI